MPARNAAAAAPAISAIVPAWNEEACIERAVCALRQIPEVAEIIVVDGGSEDRTVERARRAGTVIVLDAPRGRGSQLAAGAQCSRGAILWFVHADVIAPPHAGVRVLETLRDPRVAGGHFRPRFDGPERAARFLTALYPRLSLLGLKYGDAALFVRRASYEQAGGFRPYPIFEDIDLLRRLRRVGRMAQLADEVVASSRRFEGRSFARTFAAWTLLQVLYWSGVSPERLGRWYPALRAPGKRRALSSR